MIMDIPESGAVFTIGKSSLSSDDHQSYFFIKNDAVKKLVAGKFQSAVICESGRLFVWGKNQYGQLGISSSTTITRPSCVKEFKSVGLKVKNITFGGDGFSIVITNDNRIFFCGKKITNTDENVEFDSKPFEIEGFGKLAKENDFQFKKICAGMSHFVVLTECGKCYGWGSNQSSQITNLKSDAFISEPHEIQIPEKIYDIQTGHQFTIFKTETNKIIIQGNSLSISTANEQNNNSTNLENSIIHDFSQKILSIHISDDDDIFIIFENYEILKNFEKLENLLNENEKITDLTTGNKFISLITKNGKFLTNYDNEEFHEVSKFQNMTVLSLSGGFHHVLVHAVPRPMHMIIEGDLDESMSKGIVDLLDFETPRMEEIKEIKEMVDSKDVSKDLSKVVTEILEKEETIATSEIQDTKEIKVITGTIVEIKDIPEVKEIKEIPEIKGIPELKEVNEPLVVQIIKEPKRITPIKDLDSDTSLPNSECTVIDRTAENSEDEETIKQIDKVIGLVKICDIAEKMSQKSIKSDEEEKMKIVDISKAEVYSISSKDGHLTKVEVLTSSSDDDPSVTPNEIRFIDNGIDVTDDIKKIDEKVKKRRKSEKSSSILRSSKVGPIDESVPYFIEDQFLGEKLSIFSMKEIRDSKFETQQHLREVFDDKIVPPTAERRKIKTPMPIKSKNVSDATTKTTETAKTMKTGVANVANPFEMDSDEDRKTTASVTSDTTQTDDLDDTQKSMVEHDSTIKFVAPPKPPRVTKPKEVGAVKQFFIDFKESSCRHINAMKTSDCMADSSTCCAFTRKPLTPQPRSQHPQTMQQTTQQNDSSNSNPNEINNQQTSKVCTIL